MKKLIIIFLAFALFTSCSEYQKIYNGKDVNAKYKMAWQMYEKGKYRKADALFSQIDKYYKFKPQYQRLLFAHAMSLYNMKQYLSAGELLRKFTRLFPESSKAEEADFYIVKAYANLSPKYSVDQAYTIRGIQEVEQFLKKYPYSKYKKEVNEINKELTQKIEKKHFEISKQYYDLDYYKSAIVSFNNFLIDYPGSIYKPDALFYRFKAAADLALNSVESKKEERLKKAIEYYKNFTQKYSQSPYQKEAEKLYKQLKKQLKNKASNEV
jgi:outer membrane protein assembly factor BamD